MGDIVNKIFSGFTNTITNLANGLKTGFEQILWADPTAETKVLSTLAEWGLIMFGISLAIGLVSIVTRMIRG